MNLKMFSTEVTNVSVLSLAVRMGIFYKLPDETYDLWFEGIWKCI